MAGGPSGTSEGVSNASLVWAIVMSAFAAFGGILFGYDTGTIGGVIAMQDWLNVFGQFDPTGQLGKDTNGMYLTTSNKSLVVSILSAGTFFGALLAFPMGDMVGRKWGIVCSCVIFSLGVGLQLDTKWATFVVGRVIAGIGVGLVSCLVPMYQSECSPKNIRGLIVGLYQLAITIGALLAAIVLNSTKDEQSHAAWRTPIAVQFAWAFILGGGMLLLPESPRYLLHKGRVDKARRALARLTNRPADSLEVEADGTYADCFKNTKLRNGLRTWTGIMLQGWQQLTGINFIFYYGTTFFQSAGIQNPFIITIIADVVNTCMTIVGINLIDRVGRRRLLLIGATGMMVCEYIVAIVGVTAGKTTTGDGVNQTAQRVLIAFVCFYIAFFATSWGPVAWVVTGEIFPLNIRAKGHVALRRVQLALELCDRPNGVATAGLKVKVFFIWGSTCLGCLIFTYFFIPETKGLSLEQIDLLYQESSIINSNKYRKKMIAESETHAHHDKVTASHDESLEDHPANVEKV
ncbi:putative glucose transporter rco-3 [Mycena venus]|uniref:Putative glucose transporter rco-3 n=1 Tax=Mycena venus TaxID=2733690 RepID=A0A8H6WYY3_9AGAR|nr:putative glucose transporter rco-3 [Mycena venus]